MRTSPFSAPRVSPAAWVAVGAVVLCLGLGVVASRNAAGASDDVPALPHDAKMFGFAIRAPGRVPLLEATHDFTLALANGPVHGAPPDPARLRWATALVSRELDRYPAAFLRRVRLAGVVLTEELREGTMPIPSLPNVGGLLLLDVRSSEAALVSVLHHELFHFFDLADDGRLAPDPAWARLNPEGFLYGSGGRTLRGAWAAAPTELPGVLSAYATSAVEEDKAETFAFAVTRPDIARDRAAKDPAVRAKLDEIVRRVGAVDPSAPRQLGLDTFASTDRTL